MYDYIVVGIVPLENSIRSITNLCIYLPEYNQVRNISFQIVNLM